MRFQNDTWGLTAFTEPIALIICFLVGIYILFNWKNIKLNNGDKLVLAFIASILVSSFFSWSLIISIKFWIIISVHFGASYLAYKFCNKENILPLLTKAFIGGHLILAIFSFVNALRFGIFYETSYLIAQPFVVQGHSNLSIMLEAPALLCLLLLVDSKRTKNKKLVLLLSLIIFTSVIIFSCSRTSYVTLITTAVGLLIYLFKQNSFNSKTLLYILMPLVVSISIWKVNDIIHEQRLEKHKPNYYDSDDVSTYKKTSMYDELSNIANTSNRAGKSSQERLERWTNAISLWKTTPTTGIGPGTFADRYQFIQKQSDDPYAQELSKRKMNLHNMYLSWLTEGGILVFILGFTILLSLILIGRSLLRDEKVNTLNKGLIFLLVPFLVHSFVQDYSNEPRVMIPFWVCLSILYSIYFNKEQTTIVKSST